MPARHPTARRLISEGMRLFAERGLAGTPVTHIEAAAGLAPGSGAFYKHFRSKHELYAAAVADAAQAIRVSLEEVHLPEALGVEGPARLIARGVLATLDSHHDLLLVTMRERSPLPEGEALESVWPASGHSWFARWLGEMNRQQLLRVLDAPATAVLLLGALTGYWLNRQATMTPVLGVDDDRFVEAWVQTVLAMRR